MRTMLIPLALAAGLASTAHSQIQTLINNATSGDVIVLPPGVYSGPGNRDIDFQGKAITLRSANGPADCIIDCQFAGRGFIFKNGETTSSKLVGITIRNGSASLSSELGNRGGGILFANSGPAVRNCVIENCSVDTQHLGFGGGMNILNADPVVRRCRIIMNGASSGLVIGGGIAASGNSEPTLYSCCITDNAAGIGGGVHVDTGSNVYLENCTIAGNNAASFGGGLATASIFTPQFTLYNSVVWGNTAPSFPTIAQLAGNATVAWSNVEGSWPGIGNTNSNPRFVNAAAGDYHIRRDSPCVNAGDPTFTGGGRDIDGQMRVWQRVDQGCDELLPIFIQPVPFPIGP